MEGRIFPSGGEERQDAGGFEHAEDSGGAARFTWRVHLSAALAGWVASSGSGGIADACAEPTTGRIREHRANWIQYESGAFGEQATGRDLVQRKVKTLYLMAGNFQKPQPEYNVFTDGPAFKSLMEDWPTPIVFSGFEVGLMITFPYESVARDFACTADHPIAEAYRIYVGRRKTTQIGIRRQC